MTIKHLIIVATMLLTPVAWSNAAYAEGDRMAQVQLILKKLRTSAESLKDFDALEEAGMDKRDVNRMRDAMKLKLKQMTSEAVLLIRAL